MFTDDSGVALIALVGVIEEAYHILGQHLMVVVVLDEAVLEVIDTFAAEEAVDRRQQRISTMASSMRLVSAFLLLGPSSISSMCSRMRACSVMR